MGILDDLNKTVAGGVSRVKFEARKLQKTTRIQSEIYELRQHADTALRKLGQQALDLYRSGQLAIPELSALAATIQPLQSQLAAKEQELSEAQAEVFVEPAPPEAAQRIPIETEPATPDLPLDPPAARVCSRCGFLSPPNALFCSNCGTRVAP